MADPATQSYANHARVVPGYHYAVTGLLLVNAAYRLVMLFNRPGLATVVDLLFALGVAGVAWYARIFALAAQDRVIRLEMRLRLRELLPADLQPRIAELRPRHLVALRFASDAELPGLVRDVLEGRLKDGRSIKQAIKDWQADHLRV
jgi:hypothetical protein